MYITKITELDLNTNNNTETIDNNNSRNSNNQRNQSGNKFLTENNSDNIMQIQKQKLDSENFTNNTTYESINKHNNNYNKKDIHETKTNTKKVRNLK